jgi:hypothetical protein
MVNLVVLATHQVAVVTDNHNQFQLLRNILRVEAVVVMMALNRRSSMFVVA